MVCQSNFTMYLKFIFVINDMDKDNRRQDKHTSSVIKKGKFVIKKREKIYVPELLEYKSRRY